MYQPKTCGVCGRVFTPERPRLLYCSRECRMEMNRRLDRESYWRRSDSARAIKKALSENRQEIIEINDAARKNGLSYGAYVGKYGRYAAQAARRCRDD